MNPEVEFTDADLDFIVVSLRIIMANFEEIKTFLYRFRNGLVVPLQKEGKEIVIKLIDVENNEFLVN